MGAKRFIAPKGAPTQRLFMLRCPLCHSPLPLAEKQARCEHGHSFDRAREGYFNLLPVQQKNSLNPGDDAAMVTARRAFLEAGFYQPFREKLGEMMAALNPTHWVDSGCSEGWYTHYLAQYAKKTTAFDISKDAVKRAAKRSRDITWLVASSQDMPLLDARVSLLSAIFSPIKISEVVRVLEPGGYLLIAAPGERHLWELRAALYPEVRPHQAEKWQEELKDHFSLQQTMQAQFTIELPDNAALHNLLQMTPHYWRAPRDRRQALAEQPRFSTQADFQLFLFQKPL